MRIYTGKVFADLIEAQPGWIIFEDCFKEKTSAEYADCWPLVLDEAIICKTNDAIRSAPPDATVIRIGRSVRKSDYGQIIETEMTMSEWMFLDPAMSVDRRQTQD